MKSNFFNQISNVVIRHYKKDFRTDLWKQSSGGCFIIMWISKLFIVIIFCHFLNNACFGLYMNPDSLTKAYNKAYLKQFPNAPKKIHQLFPQFHGNYIFKLSRVTQLSWIRKLQLYFFNLSYRKKKSLTYCHGNNVQLWKNSLKNFMALIGEISNWNSNSEIQWKLLQFHIHHFLRLVENEKLHFCL